jgi:hypothetical protein
VLSLTADERVVELLRTLAEARQSYSFASGSGGPMLMPKMWHEGSYAELERRLRDMRESRRRRLWWHVSYRYRFGVELTMVARIVRRQTGPEFMLPPHCELVAGGPAVGSKAAYCRVYCWRQEVDEGQADRGVGHLVSTMYGGEVDRIVLPDAVYRYRMGLPPRELELAGGQETVYYRSNSGGVVRPQTVTG